MSKGDRKFFFASLVLALTGSAYSDPLTYQEEFTKEVVEFANLNRLQIGRLHRDVHADCYIPVIIAFHPLANYYDPVPEEITVMQEFRLDAGLWREGISSAGPCDELKPRGSKPDQ
jgi:hypothetical protein